MTEREQFEAAMCRLAEQPESSFEKPYDNDDVNAHWAVWQASRRAALEEAAKVCDQMVSVSAVSYETGSACAAASRALPQKTAQGEAK